MKTKCAWILLLGVWLAVPVMAAEPEGTIGLSGAWALYPMAVRWGEEFQKLHPDVEFDISAGGAGKGMTDVLAGAVDIGLVSRDVKPEELEKGAVAIAVTKDAVIPMISAKNPELQELLRKGVGRTMFERIWISGDVKTWGDVTGTAQKAPLRVYTRSDACGAAETWARYLGKVQEDLKGIGVYGDPGLGEAVRRDAAGIGYNNVNFAYDARTFRPVAGLAVLPIDVNANGQVDPAEDFYQTRQSLTAAIARGDYPSPPARDLYFVTRGTPDRAVVVEFIKWVLTDGQAFVEESGYIRLSDGKLGEGARAVATRP